MSNVEPNQTRPKLDPVSAPALADLMLATAAGARADAVTLRGTPSAATVFATTDEVVDGLMHVPSEVAVAAAARIALAAGLDPLLESGAPEAQCGVVHVQLEPEGGVGEVVVTTRAQSAAWEITVKPVGAHSTPASEEQRSVAGARAQEDPRPGGTIGSYQVLAELGEGGMGVVLEAEHALIGRRVAIKVLRRSLAQNPAAMRRFLAEARAANQLVHPNVVAVTDYGILRDGRPYVVMERLRGESLDARLDREAAIEPVSALRIAREIALALEAIHEAGVQHNDLKPANVLLLAGSTDDVPRLKLLDFGAALTAQDQIDGDDLVVGTPAYMAPERARGEAGDARSDLYALGVTLYEILTGAPPFAGESPTAVLCAQIARKPPRLSSPRYEIPAAVEALVARALAKKPAERPASAREMLFEIETALATCSRRGWRRLLP